MDPSVEGICEVADLKIQKQMPGNNVGEKCDATGEEFHAKVATESSSHNTLVLSAINEPCKTEHLSDIQTFGCKICERNFASYKILKRHMAEHHTIQKQLFQCEVCFHSCRRKFNMQVHIRANHGGK